MDDFSGLNWPSSNNNNSQQQQKSASNSPGAGKPSAMRSTASGPNYSPSMSSPVLNFSTSQQSRSGSSAGKPLQKDPKDDPFGELVSFTSSQPNQAKMTLRERQQILEEQTKSRSGSPFATQSQSKPQQQQKDVWNFDVLEQVGASRPSVVTPVMQKRSTGFATGSSSNRSAMDFDPFSVFSGTQQTRTSNNDNIGNGGSFGGSGKVPSKSFGSGHLLDDNEPIPMDFNLPAVPIERVAVRPTAGQPADAFADNDFEIAQIVDYGFTAEQAKAALEITSSTRAAIQLLREQQSTARQISGQQMQQKQQPRAGRHAQSTVYHERPTKYRDSSSDDDQGTNGYNYGDPRAKTNGRDRGDQGASSSSQKSVFSNKVNTDVLLAQANEIGTNVWKQANSWFAMGKKKIIEIQETVLEQRKADSGSGRPWRDEDYLPSVQPYRDSSSDDDADVYVSANRRGHQPERQPDNFGRKKESFGGRSDSRPAAQTESFIDMNARFGAASSPSLGSGSQQQQRYMSSPSMYASRLEAKSASQSPRPPAAAIPAAAQIPALPGHILQGSNAAKTRANDQFKLGQFGDAIIGYTDAVTSVVCHSSAHPILILLYNNRALAYMRNGESKNALGDCSLSLELCELYQGNGIVELGAESGRVDIVDQRAKALQRRGEACEAGEKYTEALDDWKRLKEVARDSGSRQQSMRGIQRCEKALGINQPVKPKAPVVEQRPEDIATLFASISIDTIKSKGTTILNQDRENSAAVAEMRRNDEAKRVEDDQRMAIIDQVDAEIKRWRDGKQQNLRALLSSLHTLLPDFKPIGMHEILEPNKVKRAYMRAISRLHPDKLSKDVDVRTKMVSSSVFTALNESWDAFKAQEGVN
ncbi:auxilin-like clathrin-binding protein required for normal clathrin function [Kickxella alabastrina]|uniref:Auxilin-like clathrin-binding protein required for normal clathrin function n=1 Tax=Kickxella alabastrina TaxID=61397 RepID=A0ACC1IWE7_9FUNG|nr:auxilin-like clathrin-binding protein required for normal clathrin function [Kickxella alabastrina]